MSMYDPGAATVIDPNELSAAEKVAFLAIIRGMRKAGKIDDQTIDYIADDMRDQAPTIKAGPVPGWPGMFPFAGRFVLSFAEQVRACKLGT